MKKEENSITYKKLENFIRNRMRMAHIYQPVMLKELLLNGGMLPVEDIAKSLLAHDQSQIEYYEQITKNMVGKVLTDNNGITERIKDGTRIKGFTLSGYQTLTSNEIKLLVDLCDTKIKEFIDIILRQPYTHKIKILDVHVNREIYQPKQYRYLGGINRTKYIKGKDGRIVDYKDYIQYFKAWNATFTYKGFNLDMNNDIEFECVPNALFKTYGTKKEVSNQYLHSVHKGGLDYVKKFLNRNNKTEDEKPIKYVNPYDKMIKDAERMIKEYINRYEYNIDYEFDVNSIDDIKDKVIKEEIESLYKSIDEYTEQKDILDNNKNPYEDDKIVKTHEKRIEELKTQYNQNLNKNNQFET